MHKNMGMTSLKLLRLDQNKVGVKTVLSMEGKGAIRGADYRVVLTLYPHIDTRGIEVRIISGEIQLYTMEEGRRSK